MTTRVAIVGATGKLGRIVCDVVSAMPAYAVHARLGSSSALSELDGADVIVDVSTPAVSGDIVRAALERHTPIVVGTSGWSEERIAAVRPRAAEAGSPVIFVPNFSLGSVWGSALAAAAAPFFSFIEIVESHRDSKVDSPSGTAVRTAELIADARSSVGPVDAPHVDQRARGQQVASVPVHSLRRPGVIAQQQVIMSGPGESLTITHDTVDPAAAYAPGIRAALHAAPSAHGVTVGLEKLLNITASLPGSPEQDEPFDEGGVPGQVARTTGA